MTTLKDRFLSAASQIFTKARDVKESVEQAAGLLKTRADRARLGVTRKVGKPRTPYRHIIRYERKGPFLRQVGVRHVVSRSGQSRTIPIMQQFYVHRFLHATKGWREYANIPLAMRVAAETR